MKALEKDIIISEAEKIRPGTITRVCYMTEQKVKAESKKHGWKVYKVVETSVRLGVSYSNIASVIARKAEETLTKTLSRANNYEWVIKNKVSYNTNTDKYYLYVANFNKGHNTKSFYIVSHNGDAVAVVEDLKNSEYADLMLPSQWTSSSYGEIRNISFENIYKIGNSGESISKESIAV